jgi:hypothetical protein
MLIKIRYLKYLMVLNNNRLQKAQDTNQSDTTQDNKIKRSRITPNSSSVILSLKQYIIHNNLKPVKMKKMDKLKLKINMNPFHQDKS